MKLSKFKAKKKGQTWQDIASKFDVPLVKAWRWAQQGADVRKINGKLVITKTTVLAEEVK